MPRQKSRTGREYSRWPVKANEAKQDSIFQSGEIKSTGEKAIQSIDKARDNLKQRLFQLVWIQLNEIEEKIRIMMQAAEIIQLRLENAPSDDNVEPSDDLARQIAEILERLERLEDSRPNLAIVQQRKAQ